MSGYLLILPSGLDLFLQQTDVDHLAPGYDIEPPQPKDHSAAQKEAVFDR